MSGMPLRFLSGLPLIVMAAALLVLGLQRVQPHAVAAVSLADLLAADGRLEDAVAWADLRAREGDAADLRRLADLADLDGDTAKRATTLQRLVRTGKATLAEHVEAARSMAAAGALKDALTILYNADIRFTNDVSEDFLSFYVAVAIDCGRADVAKPLARRIWKRTGSERALRLMERLREVRQSAPG